MKKIKILSLSILALSLAVVSCQNKELCYDDHTDSDRSNVEVRINWPADVTPPTAYGMRVNLFSLDNNRSYGMEDVSAYGGSFLLENHTIHRTIVYSFTGNNIYFRHQLSQNDIEAYCNVMTRGTYTRSNPDEVTYAEPSGIFYVGDHPSYTVLDTSDPQYIDVYPTEKLVTYTFEVRNVKGSQFITATRGACSGMSAAYFLGKDELSPDLATILFNASVDTATDRIVGSFRTFGRLDVTNKFTVEILFPSNTNGIYQGAWDVTDQIDNGTNFHIVVDLDFEIPDEGGENTGSWDVDVNEWEDIDVPLN